MTRPRFCSLSRLLSVIAVAAALMTTGCAAIPTAGEVRAGEAVPNRDQGPFAFSPAGPAAGASATEILRGFVAAAVRPQDRYSVARQFLTTELAATWDPQASVVLHESPNEVREEGNGVLELDVEAVGSVDRQGVFAQQNYTSSMQFRLVQVAGEWRIAEAPDGVVLLRQTFERLYTQRTLYFFDPSFANLVPDVRWFTAGADQPTRAVQALLAGPAPILASPVSASAFPAGVSLAKDSVIATSGRLVVDLDASIAGADTLALQRMRLQLTRSLVSGSIVGVELRAGGSPLDIPELTDGPVQQSQTDPRVAVGDGTTFGWLVSGQVQTIEGIGSQVAALSPTAVALDAASGRAAVLTGAGVYLVRPNSEPLLVDERTGLIPPVLDSRGYVWTMPAGEPGRIQVAALDGSVTTIETGWNDLSSVASLGVSRDGTRLLLYGSSGGVPVLRVSGVIRDADRRPVALTAERFELVAPAGSPTSATWADDMSVASLARTESGGSAVMLQTVGGFADQLSSPEAASAILGGSGEASLRVLTDAGDLLVLRGAVWQTSAGGIRYAANQR